MRKLVYYVACSLDGFIAREDGSMSDFEMGGEHFEDLLREFPETIPGHLKEQLQVSSEKKRFDTVLMGRRTYEVGLNFGITSPYPHLNQFVVSRSLTTSPDEAVTLINENPIDSIRELKRQSGMDIWLCGGGSLAKTLLSEIDEVILKVNPFIMGAGISFVAGSVPKTTFNLQSTRPYDNGFMLNYFVVNH